MARILVIGGSLGGLLAANVLHRQGHEVCVLEKVRGSMDGRGAGIVTHDALFAALGQAGLQVDEALGVQVRQRVALDAQGRTEVCIDMPQVLTSWSRLYDLLHQLLPPSLYVQGVTVQKIEQQSSAAVVHGLGPQPLPGVANLGVRPSLDPGDVNGGRVLLETHCLDWPATLGAEGAYGKIARVELLHKLHDELKYEGLDALTRGIHKDCDDARAWLAARI